MFRAVRSTVRMASGRQCGGVSGQPLKGGRRIFSTAPPGRNSERGIFYRNVIILGGIGFAIGSAIQTALNWNESASASEEHIKSLIDHELAPVQSQVTDRVFLDISFPSPHDVKERVVERIVIGLYGRDCPSTTLNFLSLCEGFHKIVTPGTPPTTRKLSYEHCPIHRIIPAFMMQSGDFTVGDGTGGESIFSTRSFPDESFRLKHTGLGILSMANRGRDTNTSQFFLCFKQTPWLDGRHVVFGQVLSGASTLRRIETFGDSAGHVSADLWIEQCGKLPPLEEAIAMQVNLNEILDETGRNADSIMK
jgi:peptidylprolyl isomerase